MWKRIKALFLILTLVAFSVPASFTAHAESAGNGVYALSGTVGRSGTVTVEVRVPELPTADSMSITLSYDKDDFSIASDVETDWKAAVRAICGDSDATVMIVSTEKAGEISMSVASGKVCLDFSDGLELPVDFKANADAVLGAHTFKVEEHTICTTNENGVSGDSLWKQITFPDTSITVTETVLPVNSLGLYTDAKSNLRPEESFTVTLQIPIINAFAVGGAAVVKYDTDAFEVTSVRSSVKGGTIDYGGGSFGLYIASGQSVDLKAGLTLTASVNVLKRPSPGLHYFFLENSLYGELAEGGRQELWIPKISSLKFTVSTSSDDIAVTGGGIKLSKTQVSADETFSVNIDVPALGTFVDSLYMRVEFDPSMFEIVSWSPSIEDCQPSYGNGYFDLYSLGNTDIDMRQSTRITAKMRARYGAVSGSYRFRLTYPSIIADDNAGNDYEMWKPTHEYADMYITSGSYSEQVSGGGITLSRSQINTGEMFTVYITVPPIADQATTMSVRFDYDSNVFEPVTWNTAVSGTSVYTGSGYYELYFSDKNRPINLSNGLTLAVTMQSRASNYAGSFTFNLTQSVLTAVTADGNSTMQLWYPSNKSAVINLTLTDALNPYGMKTTTTTAAVTTQNVTHTEDDVERIGDDDTDDPTDPDDIYRDDDDDDDEPTYIVTDEDDPDDEIEVIEDDSTGDDTTSPPVTYKVDFSLSTDLDGLKKGDVLVATKYDFFTGDTGIVLRNTDEADRMALKALERLELTNHEFYAFDISLYDKKRGAYIASLGAGYMDFYVPVPKNLEKVADSIGVYHIENGYPEYIKGSVVTVNGQKKVKFRANTFSPYMFVDLVNVKPTTPSSGGNAYIVPTTNNTGSKTGYNGNVNPATGVAAAILIPAALTGCVMLARKQKPHRKRSRKVRNRPEEEQN